jgi:hypothetical protein
MALKPLRMMVDLMLLVLSAAVLTGFLWMVFGY